MESEEWRDVIGYEGRYQVSSLGRVKTIAHTLFDSAGRYRRFPDKILSLIYGHNPKYGYAHVSLNKDGQSKRIWVHRLVASAFIANPNNLPQVNHKDGNKRNNKVENLEWCSCADNLKHALNMGLRPDRRWTKGHGMIRVEVISPDGESLVFESVDTAAKYIGYKYPSHFSRDLHERHGRCINGFSARRLDNFKSKFDNGTN